MNKEVSFFTQRASKALSASYHPVSVTLSLTILMYPYYSAYRSVLRMIRKAFSARYPSFPYPWESFYITTALPTIRSAAHRDKSREWGRLKAKVEPLLTLGNSGLFLMGYPRNPFTARCVESSCVVGFLDSAFLGAI